MDRALGDTPGPIHVVVRKSNVILHVLAPNTAGIRAYQQAGFRTIGRRRDSGSWNGTPCDEIIMDAVPADLPTDD